LWIFVVVSWKIGDEGRGCWCSICGWEGVFIVFENRNGGRLGQGDNGISLGQWRGKTTPPTLMARDKGLKEDKVLKRDNAVVVFIVRSESKEVEERRSRIVFE